MEIIITMVLITMALSWRPVTRVLPFESLPAFALAAAAMLVLLFGRRLA